MAKRAHEPMPEHLPPMLATPGELPRGDQGWAFEVKWDGVRAIARWRLGQLRVESRKGEDVGERYPELRALGRQLGSREAVLDGEIVAFDEHGQPSFARLQRRLNLSLPSAIRRRAGEIPVTYVIFDLLYLDGRVAIDMPYRERRRLLESLLLDGPSWQTPAYQQGEGRAFLAATAEHGLEGALAKRLDAPYRPGERTREWLKIKNVNRQEFVIGGWLPGKGRREGALGALLVGYREDVEDASGDIGDCGEGVGSGEDVGSGGGGGGRTLRYAGRVGTGFDDAELLRLTSELAARARASSPFADHGVQPPRHARFVEPDLVAEVQFSRWTDDRILRHSVYLGLRSDKPASEAVLEIPARSDTSESDESFATEPYEVLREYGRHAEITAGGHRLRLSNRDKVLYPQDGFTKGQIIDYYAAVAPVLLAHLAGRALTLKRYPDGVDQDFFYEKRCPSHRPEWVQTAAIYSERERDTIDYCVVEDLPTLLWVANLAAIELHPSLALAHAAQIPTMMVFDLDPGVPASLRECCKVALLLRELFEAVSLRTLVKTSGMKGLQVYVPLNTPVTYAQTKPFAQTVAKLIEREHPKLVTSRMKRDLRTGKVLIDWSQNDDHKTTVSVYSLRAHVRPTISTPLHWDEVERATRSRRGGDLSLSVEPAQLLARLARDGDLFAPALDLLQRLPDFSSVGTGPKAARL
jgi:bifunctional non-homologous end joining protein LigD